MNQNAKFSYFYAKQKYNQNEEKKTSFYAAAKQNEEERPKNEGFFWF